LSSRLNGTLRDGFFATIGRRVPTPAGFAELNTKPPRWSTGYPKPSTGMDNSWVEKPAT